MSEFIDDLHQRIVAGLTQRLGVTKESAGMVATEVVSGLASDWRGERPYIGAGEEAARQRSERDRAIRRDHQAGESLELLVRRYRLSRVRIWQIVTGA